MENKKGKITQIISAIVDVKFDGGAGLPNILNAYCRQKPYFHMIDHIYVHQEVFA